MRADRIAPRTWLLAAIATWALLAWLLALAGMGGSAAILADDPALVRPLPQPRPSPPDRLGPMNQYGEIGARPLFAEDRRPHPFSLQPDNPEEDKDQGFDYLLTGVLITPQLRMAIVQPVQGGKSVRFKLDAAAEEIPAWRLVQIDPRSAVFEGPQGRKTLPLRVYNGSGGLPPTVVQDALEEADDGTATAPTATMIAKPMSGSTPISQAQPDPGVGKNQDDAAQKSGSELPQDSKSQMDAIRERIEARRAQLRRDAQGQGTQNPTAPANKQ